MRPRDRGDRPDLVTNRFLYQVQGRPNRTSRQALTACMSTLIRPRLEKTTKTKAAATATAKTSPRQGHHPHIISLASPQSATCAQSRAHSIRDCAQLARSTSNLELPTLTLPTLITKTLRSAPQASHHGEPSPSRWCCIRQQRQQQHRRIMVVAAAAPEAAPPRRGLSLPPFPDPSLHTELPSVQQTRHTRHSILHP